MSSRLDDLMARHTPRFLAAFGDQETIQITPYLGVERDIQAIVYREDRMPEAEFQGRNVFNTLVIQISSRDDVEGLVSPTEIKRPGIFDSFVIDGLNWGLRRILERNIGGMHKLELWDGGSGS